MSAVLTIQTTAGSDYLSFATNILNNPTGFSFTETLITVTGGATGDRFTIGGNFTYADPAAPSLDTLLGGTVTSGILIDRSSGTGVTYATLTGLNLSVIAAIVALDSESAEDFFNLVGALDIRGNDGADILPGGAADDIISGGKGADQLSGNGGNDVLQGGEGGDILRGGSGTDTLSYADSASRVSITLGTNTASGGDATGDNIGGFENVTGSAFNDRLSGNGIANVLVGGNGNDVLAGGLGGDTLNGGGGIDTADYGTSDAAVTINLELATASGGHAAGDTLLSIEIVNGSGLGDRLTGDLKANSLYGNGGNDVLNGGLNVDILRGGDGNDVLAGGQGIDRLYGDAGGDRFLLTNQAANRDLIYGFVSGEDSLRIDASLFRGGLTAGVELTADQLVLNATGLAEDAEDRFILNQGTGELFFDINGSAAGGSRLIAVFKDGIPALTGSDFDIV